MAVPKRKISKQRGNKRYAANVNLSAPALTECSHCHAPKLGHKVCPSCGYYNGEQIIIKKDKKSKK